MTQKEEEFKNWLANVYVINGTARNGGARLAEAFEAGWDLALKSIDEIYEPSATAQEGVENE